MCTDRGMSIVDPQGAVDQSLRTAVIGYYCKSLLFLKISLYNTGVYSRIFKCFNCLQNNSLEMAIIQTAISKQIPAVPQIIIVVAYGNGTFVRVQIK